MEDERNSKKKAVDILHPLSHVKWDRRGSLPSTLPESIQVVLVNDCLCVGTEYTVYLSSSDLKSWKTMVTRAQDFALACYDSKILTIGGLDSACAREITGKSWVVDVANQTYEPSSLPPLAVERHSACAVNVESAGCLVVAGGANDKEVLDSVEVLLNGRWNFMQRLPTPEFGLRVVAHDGVLYFTRTPLPSVYSCDVADIVKACETSCSELGEYKDLWRVFSSGQSHKSPVSFGNHFCMVGSSESSSSAEIQVVSDIRADRKWVVLAAAPEAIMSRASVVLSNGNLLMVARESCDIYRGVLHMSSFNNSSKFSEHSLTKLEEQGIPVLKALEEKLSRVREVLELEEEEEGEGVGDRGGYRLAAVASLNGVLKSWMSGKGSHPPTWRSLLELLRSVKEEKLSQQIESYFQASGNASTSRGSKRPRSMATSKINPSPSRSSSRIRESLLSQAKEELPSSRRKIPMLKMRELPSGQRKKKASMSKEKKRSLSQEKERELSQGNEQTCFHNEQRHRFAPREERELSQEKEQPMSQGEDQTVPQENSPMFQEQQNPPMSQEQRHSPPMSWEQQHSPPMSWEQQHSPPMSWEQQHSPPMSREQQQEQLFLQENQQPSFLEWPPSQDNELPATLMKKQPLSTKKRPSSKKIELRSSQKIDPLSQRSKMLSIPLVKEPSKLKGVASASPAPTPRRSARARSRPDRYGTPLHS